ncbi:MAG TPA: hypothetical protein PLU30_05660 [Verrucomicrobiae bacterium]|nr:hypothetical protein [Verrucomicrobiae bacterium]
MPHTSRATDATRAPVSQLIDYQGRVSVGGTNFDGTGQFKFSLVDGAGRLLALLD